MANRSILNFFTKKGTVTSSKPKKVVADASSISVAFDSGLSEAEHALVVEEIANATGAGKPTKRTVYSEKDKLMIARYGNTHGPARAIAKFVKEFPKLTDSTVRAWIAKYRKELSANNGNNEEIPITVGQTRGRPLSLPVELDTKLITFIMSLRNAGGNINRHVVHGILMGLIKSNLTKYGSCLDFNVSRGWINYLYKPMNMSRRMVSTSRPKITRSIWEETRFVFLQEIAHAVSWHDIPDELIINADQTPSKFVPTDNITMAVKGSKHIPRKGANDKRGITATLLETLNGVMLPFQLIYKGKTKRSLPSVEFPEGFSLSYNESHWSNEKESLKLLKEIINPYVEKSQGRNGITNDSKSFINLGCLQRLAITVDKRCP